MKIILKLDLDNAAFQPGDRALEIARILHKLADDLENGTPKSKILDINGNTVGSIGVRV